MSTPFIMRGIVHPEIVTLPAGWALADWHHRSGRDLLTAVIAGGDLMTFVSAVQRGANILPYKPKLRATARMSGDA